MPEHPPPQKKPEDEKPSSSAMLGAFARAEKEKGEKFTPRPAESAVKNAIPKELAEIYGNNKVPSEVSKVFAKLKGKEKRDSYVAMLAAEEAKRREKKNQKNRRNERPYKGKGNPWGIYGDRRKIIDKEFKELYSNSQEIPPDVLDTYLALRDKQLESFKSGKKREQEAVANELESFIVRQHVDAKILPTEVGKHVTQEVPARSVIEEPPIVPDLEDAPDNVKKAPLAEPERVQTENIEISFDEIKDIVSQQLGDKAEIETITILPGPEGLALHAQLDAGFSGGRIRLDGMIVNEGNTIGVQGLKIEARGYVKTMIERNIAGFSSAIKSYFERQQGKPVSGLRVGESGLTVEFKPVQTINEPENQIEPTLGVEPTQSEDVQPMKPEGTPGEWYKKLKELVKNAPERVLGTERYERTKAYLAERSQKIDAEAKQMGRTYECVKSIGEWYNRRHIVTKSAIGLALAGGTIATMGVSASMAPAFMTLIGAQRAIAAMGIFATTENKIKDSKYLSKRDKAAVSMVGSIAYSLLAGYAIKEGVEWASDTRAGEAAQDLVRHYFSGSPVETPARQSEPIRTEAAKTVPAPASVPPPDVSAEPAQAPSAETPAPAVKEEGVLGSAIREMTEVRGIESPPAVETSAAPATGEESIQTPAAPAEAPTVTAQPEVAAPSAPDVGVIPPPEKVISESTFESPLPKGPVIAAPSGEGPVLPEAGGAPSEPLIEVKIEPEPKFAQVSVDPLGKVSVNGVPEESGAPMEPPADASHPIAPETPPPAEPVEPAHTGPSALEAEPARAPVEPPPPVHIDTTVLDYPARSGEPLIVEHTDNVSARAYQKAFPNDAPVVQDNWKNAVHDRFGNPVHSGGANHFGVVVPETEAHVYAGSGGKEVFVYGGSPTERAKSILEYLVTKDPKGIVYAASDDGKYRIPWRLVEGKLVPGTPVRTGGILNFFSSWMKPPGPDDFAKIIK